MGQIFPASSGVVPPLFVGRETQMQQIDALVKDVANRSAEGICGVVLHGPRGTGKTAMISVIRQGLEDASVAQAIVLNGNDELASWESFIGGLSEYMATQTQTTATASRDASGEANLMIGKAHVRRGRETSATTIEPTQNESIQSVIRSVQRARNKPLIILVDEGHGANPEVLGRVMNAVQSMTTVQHQPVGFVLAGTPDTLDVLRDPACKASWFRDRAQDKRFAPFANDLSVDVCRNTIVETLKAAGVRIKDHADFEAILSRCKSSPYFLQTLGQSALRTAKECNDIADFAVGGEIDLRFEEQVLERYKEVWANLDGKNLSGCARQLGCLWHRQAQVDEEIDFMLVERAIRSGLRNAPYTERQPLSFEEAQTHFKHLGLLWSMTGYDEGPWSLGLPSFFDYVESRFHEPRKLAHQDVLPKLEADMDALFQRIGWGAQPQNDNL